MDIKTAVKNIARKRGYDIRDADYVPLSHERKIYEYYLKESPRVQTILDVGANAGQTALAYHESFPEAAIYSFEPFASTYKLLVANTAHLPTVRCLQVALGDTNTTMMAVSQPDHLSGRDSLIPENQQALINLGQTKAEEITIRTGASFCAENNIGLIDILKIDTEGFELPVLDGFGSILDKSVRSIQCEFCLLENKEKQTPLKALQTVLHPKGFELASVYEIRYEADGSFHYGNALFIHADHLRSERRW